MFPIIRTMAITALVLSIMGLFPRDNALGHGADTLIETTFKAIIKHRGFSYRNNLEELIRNLDCVEVDCSPKAICRYLQIGSQIPSMPGIYDPFDVCQNFSEEQDELSDELKKVIAFERFISALPVPEVCEQWKKSVQPTVGTLIIESSPPLGNPELRKKCEESKLQQRAMISSRRDEILRRLGFPESTISESTISESTISESNLRWLPIILNLMLAK